MNGTAKLANQPQSNRYTINANWLMKLRWVAVVGQVSTIAIVSFGMNISVRTVPLLSALAVTTLTNVVFTLWLSRVKHAELEAIEEETWDRVFVSLMLLDLMVLSFLLYLTGGYANPFVLFYFVNLALAGILLPPTRAWLLTGFSILCYAFLLYNHLPLPELRGVVQLASIDELGHPTLGHYGLLVAFAASSAVIVYFVTRLNAELRRGDSELRAAQMSMARSDKWEALGTLSAGAAHELATPLTTIAILSKELERELAASEVAGHVVDDFQIIRREVDRCRTILDRMSIDAGHATAEALTIIDIESLLTAALQELQAEEERVHVTLTAPAAEQYVEIPLYSVLQALRGVVQNALDASTESVEVQVSEQMGQLEISVVDRGTGMTEDVLRRADDPFFTTKEAGKGMGLGRFIARAVFERLGGGIATTSKPGKGTSVTIRLPLLGSSR